MLSPLPRYALEIDEEGWPHFDGVRVQDEALLIQLFAKLRRWNLADPRSILVTECAGELCWIKAFDAPLVAQQIDAIDAEGMDWIFPGGRRERVLFAKLEQDEWARFHAWVAGPENIPALCSRKAQAALLNLVDASKLRPSAFRERDDSKNVDRIDFWSELYVQGGDGWERGQVTPFLQQEAPKLLSTLPKRPRILVPGAGRAHEGVYFEQKGAEVTAVDFSPVARAEFAKKYPQSKLNYLVADAFEVLAQHQEGFDGVFEQAIYCAIHPRRRREYVEAVARALAPGGLYFGFFYLGSMPGGPPFGSTPWELRAHLEEQFEIRAWTIPPPAAPERLGLGLWAVLKKR